MTASTELAANLPFLAFRHRNAFLDNFFYDTSSLTPAERSQLTPLIDCEGSVIVVPPSNADRQIRHHDGAANFISEEGETIRAIVVAGLGSSILGTAALARNVADALDSEVAGIVTGYGLSDFLSEVFGGWFAFGAADRIRYAMELPGDKGVSALAEILLSHPAKLQYLLGHSKGSLVLGFALKQYVEELDGRTSSLFEQLRIMTLGSVIGVPPEFRQVKQYLGALDWFGGANSRLDIEHEWLLGVGHHLNPGLPYHMDIAALFNGEAKLALKPAQAAAAPTSPPGAQEVRTAAVPAQMPKSRKPKAEMRADSSTAPPPASADAGAASPGRNHTPQLEPKPAARNPKPPKAKPTIAASEVKSPEPPAKPPKAKPRVAASEVTSPERSAKVPTERKRSSATAAAAVPRTIRRGRKPKHEK